MTTYPTIRRRGVAMMLAVTVLGLVAAAVATVGIGVAGDLKRLNTEREQVQQQQFELSLIAIARSQLLENRTTDESPILPGDIKASITWTPAESGLKTARLTAGNRTRVAAFRQTSAGWSLDSVIDQ